MALYKLGNSNTYFHLFRIKRAGTNDFHNAISGKVFAKIIDKKARTRYKTVLSSKIFAKHDLVRSFSERSVLAVRMGKFGPLREPITKLLFSAEQFSHIIGNSLCQKFTT